MQSDVFYTKGAVQRKSLRTTVLSSTDLIGLADTPQWNPHCADHCVPYKAFIPHLNRKT